VLGRLSADGYDALSGQIARLARFEWADGAGADGEVVATVPIPGGGVEVLPSEAFDAGEARARIEKKRDGLRKEVERAERRLANEGFIAKAPPAVVEEERRKLEEYRAALARLEG
jgi:valyl-tRNA synthetase